MPKTLGFPGNPSNPGHAATGSWLDAALMGWSRALDIFKINNDQYTRSMLAFLSL